MDAFTRENAVVVACIVVGAVVAAAVQSLGGAPEWATLAALFGFAIVAPLAVNGYLDHRSETGER